MLQYTFQSLLTEQAVIERDMAGGDGYGGSEKPDWQYLATVPCRLVWSRATGVRSANRTYVSPARAVPVDEGMLMMMLGTDVTENDRIAVVNLFDSQTGDWTPYSDGNFTITAVLSEEDHMEVDVSHPHLGEG